MLCESFANHQGAHDWAGRGFSFFRLIHGRQQEEGDHLRFGGRWLRGRDDPWAERIGPFRRQSMSRENSRGPVQSVSSTIGWDATTVAAEDAGHEIDPWPLAGPGARRLSAHGDVNIQSMCARNLVTEIRRARFANQLELRTDQRRPKTLDNALLSCGRPLPGG